MSDDSLERVLSSWDAKPQADIDMPYIFDWDPLNSQISSISMAETSQAYARECRRGARLWVDEYGSRMHAVFVENTRCRKCGESPATETRKHFLRLSTLNVFERLKMDMCKVSRFYALHRL